MATSKKNSEATAGTKHASPTDPEYEPITKRTRQASKKSTDQEQKSATATSSSTVSSNEDDQQSQDKPKLEDKDGHGQVDSDSNTKDSNDGGDSDNKSKSTNGDASDSKDTNVKSKDDSTDKDGNEDESVVVEKGHAFFFYRPKVDTKDISGTQDVQKFYLLLSPDDAAGRPAPEDKLEQGDEARKPSHEGKPCHRLLVIPQKTFPSPGKGPKSRVWAFVDEASSDLDDLEKRLERYSYSTKTRGDRTQEPARLIGEARFNIVVHHGTSHFLYELEVPEKPLEVQEAFGLQKEGHFIIQVKNPEIKSPATERGQARYASLGQGAATLPKHLQEKFRGVRKDNVRYTALDTTEFLDVQHVELVLIAVNKDAKEEFAEVVKGLEEEVETELENEIDSDKPEDHAYKELETDEKTIHAAIDTFK
ncbi:hypothetical protein BX616_002245 [Lobosporangium transversale]|uniref:Uncharacterized protein n=1 Tax=Lobosporangium transversale TaxID=64571 RepID=A0A1Y2GG47_9FUNG|nr:hypothetical protein BCR41DRAFT_372569 [Lobosporangium transversale]KAF9916989.1 hypothetical protein BX616_002245 [Lobosporangium transversale]ORZ09966.1 hypothetical protein BCR41DRAFT_372569 [Lobosporangium transversale]|eukprot:XP_021879056.1 hypothetical protein BCR41DRAFT_372569 [Lobosporangium transversale]